MVDQYTKETPYGLKLHKVVNDNDIIIKPCTLSEWNEWRGKKIHWQEMCVFLNQELLSTRFQGNINLLIKEYAPPLIPGMAGALTHAIIHLGWAIDANQSDWMIIEGLAYLNFCYLDINNDNVFVMDRRSSTNTNTAVTEKAKATIMEEEDITPFDTLQRISKIYEKDNLFQNWIQVVKSKYNHNDFHNELIVAGFQWQLSKVLYEPHPIATNIPKWLAEIKDNDDGKSIERLWEQLYRIVVVVYLAMRDEYGNGNFLILHAISSLWGLENTLNIIDSHSITYSSINQYYTMLICLLSTSSAGFPSSDKLDAVARKYNIIDMSTMSNSTTTPVKSELPPPQIEASQKEITQLDWKKIEKRGIAEEEEHNIKLVYVCRELWKRYDQWIGFYDAANSFTLTPNIGPKKTSFKA